MKQNQFTGRYAGVISAILLASLITVSARGENIRGEIAGTPQIGGPEIVFNPEDIIIVDTGTI
ncbi:MAG: hypothetical protein DRP49_05240, partial [Spirochaetes bacterium]